MVPNILILLAACIIGALGFAHLLFTFKGPKLHPTDASAIDAMKESELVLTSETSVWKAWIGFNASHSMAALLFAFVYGYLALAHSDLLFDSLYLQSVGLCMLAGFTVLAKLYWFSKPFAGAAISLSLFLFGVVVAAAT